MFRRLSALYGWTPRQIAALTPAQACAYLSESNDEAGVQWMSPPAAAECANARRAERDEWIDEQLRRVSHGAPYDA